MTPARYDLLTLEFAAVRELLIERLSTPLARSAVEAVAPLPDAAAANRALAQASALAQRLQQQQEPPLAGAADVRSWLPAFLAGERLPETREVADLKRLLRAGLRCRTWLQASADEPLHELAAAIPDLRDLVDELELMIDDRGEVLSSASAKLAEIRREIDAAEAGVRASVQRFLADEQVRRCLQSPEPAWRHGRPVFQVRQELRHRVPGVLHDRSQSGATLFIEPSSIVEAANVLSDARAAEHREILVVLAHVYRGLRRCQVDVEGAVRGIVALDMATARARLIHRDGFLAVPVVAGGALRLRGARHPILLRRGPAEPIVPLDVSLGDPYRLLVITGPNTGGKTVALKTVGVLALMAQCGLPIPAAAGSQVPFYDGVFADIGDEQAITQNLSTFSSHVRRIARCLGEATARSLVLLDELGAGTDPEEGGALGYAVLEELERRGIHAAVTTHLGRLKDFAYRHTGAENGSMAFDRETLQPLYRLDVGIPGVSHALDIAGRVGMPAPVVARARALMDRTDRSLEHVVEQVQHVRREAEADRQRVAEHRRAAHEAESQLKGKLQEVEVREAWIEEEATAVLEQELRAARERIEAPLRDLQNAPRPFGDTARALAEVLRDVLRGTTVHRRRMKFIGSLRKDAVVYLPRFGRRAVVKKVDRVRETCNVELGKMRMDVPFEDVSWLQPLDGERAP